MGAARLEAALHHAYMAGFKAFVALLPFRWPLVFEGPGSVGALCRHIAQVGHRRVLVVTDPELLRKGVVAPVVTDLEQQGIEVVQYNGIVTEPSVTQVEAGLAVQQEMDGQAILALGGGSVLDAAKLIAARARNHRSVAELTGLLRVRRGMLPLYAAPTTAGSGSEVTVGAVVRDDTRQVGKRAAMDLRLLPRAAALDAHLMTGLPPYWTAITGLDALSHAVEAYLSRNATRQTDHDAREAVRLVSGNLEAAWRQGKDLEARQALARGAHLAGRACTVAGIGYAHAIAHQVGPWCGRPHGEVVAATLPLVLEAYRSAGEGRLAQLADPVGVGDSGAPAAALIRRLHEFNRLFGIPDAFEGLGQADLPALARAACAEVRWTYAVPRYLDLAQVREIMSRLQPVERPAGLANRDGTANGPRCP
ncbi:iron-containing alcohol dehydrogenase [Halorhodospira sp. 9622]|uniref:iron-containing alcohol dehydrogenase n=1 Tax=Halorhodospira sp. 9622 TaxID=2899136 RepID=UPI001EE7F309|nr:iron-containing alcohol dehydrogenase [Halorhodospira sp. 9622]MCG5536967.1 iron-containing alcohol dehydrogenase [Halorhodospira sp. 9622]